MIVERMLQQVPVGRAHQRHAVPGARRQQLGGSAARRTRRLSGGSGLDNQYVIDGVNVTNQGYGALGSYSIVFGSLGNATPFDFIKEVQVKTGGYEAEFGQATGGVVNVITKSGSNTVPRLGCSATRGRRRLEGDWTQYQSHQRQRADRSARTSSDAGAEGGGPIVQDKLFFFGAIDPSWDDAHVRMRPPDFPARAASATSIAIAQTLTYSAKGDVAARRARTGSTRRSSAIRRTATNGPQRDIALLGTDTAAFSSLDLRRPQPDGPLQRRAVEQAGCSKRPIARALNDINEMPSVDTWRVTDRTVTPNVVTGGIGFYEAGNRSLNNQYAVKSTNIFGGHQVKYGFEYDDVDYSQINQRTGPTFTAPDGRQTATGAQIDDHRRPGVREDLPRHPRQLQHRRGRPCRSTSDFFVQDTWRVGNRLTINPGLRYEQEKLAGTIVTDFTLKNNWAPRIGATFD